MQRFLKQTKKVCQIGNSLGITLDADWIQKYNIQKKDELEYCINEDTGVLTIHLIPTSDIRSVAMIPSYVNQIMAMKIRDYVKDNPRCQIINLKFLWGKSSRDREEYEVAKNYLMNTGHLILEDGRFSWLDEAITIKTPKPIIPTTPDNPSTIKKKEFSDEDFLKSLEDTGTEIVKEEVIENGKDKSNGNT